MTQIKTVKMIGPDKVSVKVETPGFCVETEYDVVWLMKAPYITFSTILGNSNYGELTVENLTRMYSHNAQTNGNNNSFSLGPKRTSFTGRKVSVAKTETTEEELLAITAEEAELEIGVEEVEDAPINYKRVIDME